MRVLIAFESSGTTRDAFVARGHNAWSCDLLPGRGRYRLRHHQRDVREILADDWDLMIAHPTCTFMCGSGARWRTTQHGRHAVMLYWLDFVRQLIDAPIPHIAIENPVGAIGTHIRKADQYIQPWQFGHGETKKTGLWLKNLPLLTPTDIVEGRDNRVHRMSPGPDRWQLRSETYQGWADAFADQWGQYVAQTTTGAHHV